MLGQFVAKAGGGFIWSLVLVRFGGTLRPAARTGCGGRGRQRRQNMIEFLRVERDAWLYDLSHRYDSIYYWLVCLKCWWAYRPRLIRCAYCGQAMWQNGLPEAEVFCGPNCAYIGGMMETPDDEVPF
jgi:hypothetical protein